MEAIWKFELECAGSITVSMPAGSRILCVQAQGNQPCIWAKVNTDEVQQVNRNFSVYGTGRQHETIGGIYIGTFQLMGGNLVFHVFEDQ